MKCVHDNFLDFHTGIRQTLYMFLFKILDNLDKKERCLAAPVGQLTFVLNKGNAGAQPLSGYCKTVCVAIKGSSGRRKVASKLCSNIIGQCVVFDRQHYFFTV